MRKRFLVVVALIASACSDSGQPDVGQDKRSSPYAFVTPTSLIYVDTLGMQRVVAAPSANETWVDVALQGSTSASVTSLLGTGAVRTIRLSLASGAVGGVTNGVRCERFTAGGVRSTSGDTVMVGGSKLTVLNGMASCPAWSEDGQFFVVPIFQNNVSRLYRISVANPVPLQLMDAPAGRLWFDPAIFGNSLVAAVAASNTGDNQIWTMNADGSNAKLITSVPGIFGLSWPDADHLCGSSTLSTNNSAGLFKVQISDKTVTKLASGTVYAAWCLP